VGDVVNGDLQLYFIRTINLLRDDLVFSKDSALHSLANDACLQQLLPYFLEFIFGQMTLHFQEIQMMDTLIAVARSLVCNKALCSELYVHPLLKIAFSGLLGLDYASLIQDEDNRLREHSAELLRMICQKYELAYPDIRIVAFNHLVDQLFECNITLAAQYGALLGIMALGSEYVERIVLHLPLYWGLVRLERESEDQRQHYWVEVLRIGLRCIAGDMLDSDRPEEVKIAARRLKCAVDSL
jgi:transcription initiation factor TFIID subunit 6